MDSADLVRFGVGLRQPTHPTPNADSAPVKTQAIPAKPKPTQAEPAQPKPSARVSTPKAPVTFDDAISADIRRAVTPQLKGANCAQPLGQPRATSDQAGSLLNEHRNLIPSPR